MKRAWLFCLLFVTAECFSGEKIPAANDPVRIQKVRDILATLKDAPMVAYRVDFDQLEPAERVKGLKHIDGYRILQEQILDDALRESTREIFVKAETYENVVTPCFNPGMALKFSNGKEEATFLICLECHWLYCWIGKDYFQLAFSEAGVVALKKHYEKYFPGFRVIGKHDREAAK